MKATSAWELNSIIVSLENTELMLHEDPHSFEQGIHGFVQRGSVRLSLEEAEALAQDILNACQNYRRIEDECIEYFNSHKEK